MQVANGSLLDFEAATNHEITVKSTDAAGLSIEKTLIINVNNVNQASTAIQLSNTSINENSPQDTVIGILTTTEPDVGDTYTYSLLNDANGRFAISGNQLIVANSALLNFEQNPKHEIIIRSQDAGGLTYDQTFTIDINNLEEPDLTVELTSVPTTTVNFGVPFDVSWVVRNTGEDPTTSSWSDRYLDFVDHTGGLVAGDSYTITKNLRLSNDLTGPYYVFVITDPPQYNRRGEVFEGGNEGNNATPSAQPLIIELPPPSDLQVDSISLPSSGQTGDPIKIEWTVFNRSNNNAEGQWTDAVYLSNDAIWDISDRPIGRVGFSGTLKPGESYTSQLAATLPPAIPGQYRIIVRPDIFNQVYEGENEANNRTTSADPLNVAVRELQLGVPLETTLNTGQERLYQVNLGLDQTLKVNLTSTASNAANELFLRFGNVPTGVFYDAAYAGLLSPNQSAVIPTTKPGTYYVLVRGQAEPSDNTPISILANVLPFGITDIKTDRGGDSRYVTTNISGAQFHPNAIVKLAAIASMKLLQ